MRAVGEGAKRKTAMLRVTLRPEVVFSGAHQPSPAQIAQMHHAAHEACFIANSVKTEVRAASRSAHMSQALS